MSTTTSPVIRPGTARQSRSAGMPPYHVILLNDDHHSVNYVIKMLWDLFCHPPEKGVMMAREVHLTGRVIVATTNLERAELKREQIHSFGPDPLIEHCEGSMSAVLERASG